MKFCLIVAYSNDRYNPWEEYYDEDISEDAVKQWCIDLVEGFNNTLKRGECERTYIGYRIKKKPVVVYACLSSWGGISIGATHHYLKLKWESNGKHDELEIDNILNLKQAKELNKADKERHPDERYLWGNHKKGDNYRGFWTREEALGMAIKVFEKKFDVDNDILFEEIRGECIFGRVLHCKDNIIRRKLEELYNRAEGLNWWDHEENDLEMDVLQKEYEELIQKF